MEQKRIFNLLEGLILLALGMFGLWLSVSGNYGLLMNEKFRWLTFTGSALVLLMGAFSLMGRSKRPASNVLFFFSLFIIVLLGRPYLPNEFLNTQPESLIDEGILEHIDQDQFPKEELSTLSISGAEKSFEGGFGFTTIGVVKRLESLDEHSSFALMSTFMFCCLADQFGIGFRVPTDQLESYEDGQWIIVSGKLAREQTVIDVPNFRFGSAMFSSTNEDYFIQADQIKAYDRLDQMPLLSDLILNGEKTRLFAEALEKSGLMKELEGKGPFTVFLPVNEAIEDLETPLEDMSSRELKNFTRKHVVEGLYLSNDLMMEDGLKAMNRSVLQLELENGKIRVNQSRLLFKDTEARNGVIHFIYPAI